MVCLYVVLESNCTDGFVLIPLGVATGIDSIHHGAAHINRIVLKESSQFSKFSLGYNQITYLCVRDIFSTLDRIPQLFVLSIELLPD